MPLNIPNLLTWARILLIPLVVGVYYLPLTPVEQNFIATAAFLVAAITTKCSLDCYWPTKLVSEVGDFLGAFCELCCARHDWCTTAKRSFA